MDPSQLDVVAGYPMEDRKAETILHLLMKTIAPEDERDQIQVHTWSVGNDIYSVRSLL